jgi:hypothetical protein
MHSQATKEKRRRGRGRSEMRGAEGTAAPEALKQIEREELFVSSVRRRDNLGRATRIGRSQRSILRLRCADAWRQ